MVNKRQDVITGVRSHFRQHVVVNYIENGDYALHRVDGKK